MKNLFCFYFTLSYYYWTENPYTKTIDFYNFLTIGWDLPISIWDPSISVETLGPQCETWDLNQRLETSIWDLWILIWDLGISIWDLEILIWDLGISIRDFETSIRDLGILIWDFGISIWDLGPQSETWGFQSETWGSWSKTWGHNWDLAQSKTWVS